MASTIEKKGGELGTDLSSKSAGKKSKRTPTRLRAKIQKASAAKQRKMRKLAKKVRFELPSVQTFLVLIYNSVGSNMAIENQEGSRHSEPLSVQGKIAA